MFGTLSSDKWAFQNRSRYLIDPDRGSFPAGVRLVISRIRLLCFLCASALLADQSTAANPEAAKQDPAALARWQLAVARNTAVRLLEEVRIFDAAIDQWTIEKNKPVGAMPTPQDLLVYVRKGTRLHTELAAGRFNDALGNPMTLRGVGKTPLISKVTVEQFASVMQPGFWKPFYEGPELSTAPLPEPAPPNPTTTAELRLTAVRLVEEMRALDTAMDEWAIANNRPHGAQPRPQDLIAYVQKGSRLYGQLAVGRLDDSLGNPITLPPMGQAPTISDATAQKLATIVPADFWGPFAKK